jgi:RHS repeat-associated protein
MTKETKDAGGLNIIGEWLFDSKGNLTKTIDPIGKTKVWEYNSKGLVTKAINEIGGYELFEYNNAGKQTKHTDRNGNITSYQYDALNRLTKTTDAAGYYEIKEYNSNGFVTKFTDKIGSLTNYYYDQLNHLTLIGGDAAAPGGGCSCSGGTNVNGQEGIYEYAWNGKLTKFTDIEYIKSNGAKGNFKLFEYDKMYRLTRTIVDPYGLMLIGEMEYDTLGRVTKNRKVNFDGPDIINITEYDKNSRVIITKQVLGNDYLVSSVEYDKMHNVTKSIDANGNFSQIFYDKVYRVTKTIDAENLTLVNSYNARSEITRVQVDPAGFNYITDTLYDDRGFVTKTIEPDGGIELCEYDPNGSKTKCTDPVGGIRQWLFDSRNMFTKVIDEASNFSTVEYDGLGNQTKVVNAEGTITHYMYNDKSFLTKTIEDVGGINRTSVVLFDESAHQTKTIDPANLITEIYYDSVYRITKIITDAGGKNFENVIMFDSLSQITKTIDTGGFEKEMEYDQISRVTKRVFPDGGSQSFIYDNTSNILTKTVKTSNSTNVSYSYSYNKTYQLTKSIEDTASSNFTTIQGYDVVHRLTKITDANSNATAYFYDTESRITRTLYADSNSVDSEYDQKGRITKQTDQNFDFMTYLYDSRDLLTMKTYGASGVQTFTWDVMRRKTQDTDNNSNNQIITMVYEFDKLSRITKQMQKIGTGATQNVSNFYDTYGHRTRITYPHGRNVDTTFTVIHQVDEIKTDVGAGIQTVANYDYLYDMGGADKRPLVAKNTLHSGTDTRVDFAYDSMGRVTKKNWVDISATTTLSGFEYTYNLFGNRLTDNQLDRTQDSHTYYYDTSQRFTKMERGTIGGTPSFYQGYTLDALANWSSFNNNGSSESRTHNLMNAVTVRGSTSLTYDSNGNLTNDGNQKYIWDSLNRLAEVRDSSNNMICDYYYNADNLRVEKHHAGGSKEQFYYNGATVLVETDGSQNKGREYVNGSQYIDEVILVANTSTYNYYMSDLRFCVTGFIDSSGAVVERARYDGYGKRTLLDPFYATITGANVNQSYGYTGIRHDNESGLQYYRARYFDNYLGRFINRDPIGYKDGLNLYRGYFVIADGNGNYWSCIWPTGNSVTKSSDWKKPSDWPTASKCDTADVSNLKKTEGPSLYVNLWVGDKPYLNARPEALTLLTGNGVENALKNKSNEGATPIQYFEINGHGNGTQPVAMNSISGRYQYQLIFKKEQQAFQPAPVGSTDSGDEPTATYERAKTKKGPKKCWFTRSAKTYGIMCYGKIFGDSFAGAYLRKGAWMKTTKIDHRIASPSNNDWRIKNNSGSTLESFNSLDNLLQNSVNLIQIDGKN